MYFALKVRPGGVIFSFKMLITLQFPVADARGFADALPDSVERPNWPDPVTSLPRDRLEFMRCFGPVANKRAFKSALSEPSMAKAHQAVRFPRLPRVQSERTSGAKK